MIVGTAGHIDHGKTSLVRRLTGRDTDRLPEERRRGISIELGYAYVALADGSVLGFVDVPGHEKFVHTMVAGATGIDLALLVIAADDGVMPQTEEHLDILRLLGVRDGVIALTKIDAVEPARVDEVRGQIGRWLAGSGEADWPVFEVSSASGAGIAALDAALRQRALGAARRAARGQFRLAVDRVFTLSGVGTVVTGTAHAGRVRVGDEVAVMPAGTKARVRSLHAQDRPAEVGVAGQRCALNLAGVGRDEVARGDWIAAPALANATSRIDALLRVSPRESRPLAQWSSVHFHHGTAETMARISILDAATVAPGEQARVSISLAAPIAACLGDRFVVRDASARRTLGGGEILDIAPPARGRRKPERLALLDALAGGDRPRALAQWLAAAPVPVARLADGWNLAPEELQDLLASAQARVAAGAAFSQPRWDRLLEAVGAAVAATHEREPEMPGLEQNRLRRIVAPHLQADAFAEALDELLAAGRLVRRGAFFALPGHRAELAREERTRWERIKPLLMEQPFGPPRVRDIARETRLPETEVRALLRRVARIGEVTLVAHDHFFLTVAVAQMADVAAELARSDGAVRAAAFRDRIGGGRKVAIQILEFFDRVGYTRRVRDDHLLRRDNPWGSAAGSLAPVPQGAQHPA